MMKKIKIYLVVLIIMSSLFALVRGLEYSELKRVEDYYKNNLLMYHGEFETHEVYIEFAEWGMKYKKSFVNILESIPQDKKNEFFESFAWGIVQSDITEEFLQEFKMEKDESVQYIIANIQKNLLLIINE